MSVTDTLEKLTAYRALVRTLEEREDMEEAASRLWEDEARDSLRTLQAECHAIATSSGWWESPRELGTLLALVHSEVSEALEAARKDDREELAEELADVVIRVLDLAEHEGIDLADAVLAKMEKNRGRSHRHGGKTF